MFKWSGAAEKSCTAGRVDKFDAAAHRCRNQVVVFSKTYCPYCVKAKHALGTIIRPDQMEVIEVCQRCRVC